MEMTYATSSDADLDAAIKQWTLTYIIPALAERGMPEVVALAAVASMDTPPEQRRAIVAQVRATARSWRDRDLIGLIASVLDPYPRWTLNAPASLPDALIMRLGLRQVVALARADETILKAMVADHPEIAAMDAAMDAIARVNDEIAGSDGSDWSPEVQRLAWAAARAAEDAELSVTIDTCPNGL